jgi:hypothetical protein
VTLFLLNGPPRSGKDTAARLLGQLLGEGTTGHWKLAEQLKVRTHAMYDLRNALTGKPYAADHYETTKDEPSADFRGLTPRAAYIAAHERYWKPVHGPRILGELLVREIERSPFNLPHIVISDAGDDSQCEPLVEMVGAENTVLVHLSRPSATWNDNRRSFLLPGVRTVAIENPGTDFADFRIRLARCLA